MSGITCRVSPDWTTRSLSDEDATRAMEQATRTAEKRRGAPMWVRHCEPVGGLLEVSVRASSWDVARTYVTGTAAYLAGGAGGVWSGELVDVDWEAPGHYIVRMEQVAPYTSDGAAAVAALIATRVAMVLPGVSNQLPTDGSLDRYAPATSPRSLAQCEGRTPGRVRVALLADAPNAGMAEQRVQAIRHELEQVGGAWEHVCTAPVDDRDAVLVVFHLAVDDGAVSEWVERRKAATKRKG